MNFLARTAWTTWTEDGSYSLQVSAREIGHSNFQKKNFENVSETAALGVSTARRRRRLANRQLSH